MRSALPALLASLLFSAPALHAQAPNRFAAYEHCRFADDLALVENTSLASGVQGRTVKTIMGPKQVPLAAGKTLVFGYPQTAPLATVKVEQIPTADYSQARQDLIANFEQILTGDDTSARNYTLKPRLNGLEIYGLDRKTLAGGVLGIYLFFVERTHTATTVYFLNQDPSVRSFGNLNDYAGLRDTFLRAYTGCAAGLPRGRTAVARDAPAAPVLTAPPAAAVAATALPDAPGVQGTASLRAPAVASPSAQTPDTPVAVSSAAHPAARVVAHKAAVMPTRTSAKASAKKTVKTAKFSRTTKAAASKSSKKPASKKKK